MTAGGPEGVDLESLRGYFAEHVEGADGRPLSAELIAGGRSNLTYCITDGEREWVLRRPPLGHVLPTAHDMAREYRVITALADTDVPVPKTFALCEDTDVNGAPFYVMERVHGRILRTGEELATLTRDEAAACSRELVDVLARIHRVDYEAVGIGEFGHPDGFMERQLRRWNQQWERSKADDLPAIDDLAQRLRNALPESGPPTIVHGDYRLDNTMLAPDDPGRIAAVLDWEMSTLGDPLADVGLFLLYWGQSQAQIIATGQAIEEEAGFASRDEVVELYAKETGRNVDNLDFYVVFAFYKLAIIVEGIAARYRMGKTLGEGFEHMGQMVKSLVDEALEQANRSSIPALRG
ncbi:MAG TPA: phosphotransferase family protein [Acidimicrobiia bacterium]|nr:phosphotransferase family protein [Acidimicrobiia bacterium]